VQRSRVPKWLEIWEAGTGGARTTGQPHLNFLQTHFILERSHIAGHLVNSVNSLAAVLEDYAFSFQSRVSGRPLGTMPNLPPGEEQLAQNIRELANLSDALSLQILLPNFRVEHDLLILEQHHDVGPAEHEVTELVTLLQPGANLRRQVDGRNRSHADR
jgi:hypothetical protein